MTSSDITLLRLHNQHLINPSFKTPRDVVSRMGAVQAQDFAAAKWSLAQRMEKATDESIEDAFNKGEILRTHVLRPTWHFVIPDDIYSFLMLTAPRVKSFMGSYNRKLALTDEVFDTCNSVITKAFKDYDFLTRAEIANILEENNIPARGQRLAHIVMNAELDAIICSDPRRGKQFTYALLEKRVSHKSKYNYEEALKTLALKYFTSHGPAQIKDFSWWSGLSIKDAEKGLDFIKSKLTQKIIDGKTYWFASNTPIKNNSRIAFLLSIYDEYIISYKDRSDINDKTQDIETMISMGNALTAVMIYDGKATGTWKRYIKGNKVTLELKPFRPLKEDEKMAFREAAEKYGLFLNLPLDVTFLKTSL